MAQPTPRRTRRRGTPEGIVRFLLRLPATIHRHVTERAAAQQLSLNEYCVRVLGASHPHDASAAVLDLRVHAEAVVGAHLRGLIVHGSWTRGDARVASDVDVLIVTDGGLPLTRALYRRWDVRAFEWDGRPVDVHFVHLPAESTRAGGVWCEAAVDGVVLFDADGRVQQALQAIRRDIAEGRLVRKRVHGQPYWTVAA